MDENIFHERVNGIIKNELSMAPTWFKPLIQALDMTAPFEDGDADAEAVFRASIRLALVCSAFEDIFKESRGSITQMIDEVQEDVEEVSKKMSGEFSVRWLPLGEG